MDRRSQVVDTPRGYRQGSGAPERTYDPHVPDSLRILVVVAEPDRRRSTQVLRRVVEELARREEATVDVWFLRADHELPWSDGDVVVDDLRTMSAPAAAERFGLGAIAARARGLQLRRWWRRASPDLVILDDGLGGRVLPRHRGSTAVACRWNAELPPSAALEQPWAGPADLHLAERPDLVPVGATGPVLAMGDLVAIDVSDRLGARPRPPEAPAEVVVGWGSDGWVDGADLFVRTLWALEHRCGRRAHGRWYQGDGSREQRQQLELEAQRCGVGDRFEVVADPGPARRWYGDVVLLPYRGPATDDLELALSHGREVVTFDRGRFTDPAVTACAPLDLEGAARALDLALGRDGAMVASAITERLEDVATWVDALIEHAGRGR